VKWRDGIAAELDRATFRVAGNEVLLDLARLAPTTREALFAVKGFPRGMNDARAAEALQAVARGNAAPDSELPRFPKSARWDREPDFDDRVAKLKSVRDVVATKLDLDPGVLCSRDRMEAVARRKPRHVDDLAEVTELRKWQVEVLGVDFVKALAGYANSDDSPYKPG
jgi:ribonuclease D